MFQNEKTRIAVNRILSALVGGLLVFVVMNMTVVSNLKGQNVQVTKALDDSQYEPGRLLADAKAQLANRDFDKAKATLTTLFEKRPGATEVTEGKKLYAEADAATSKDNAKWEAAVAGIRERWARDMVAQLRGQSEKARLDMEKGMTDTLNAEWEKMKGQVRQEWVTKQGG